MESPRRSHERPTFTPQHLSVANAHVVGRFDSNPARQKPHKPTQTFEYVTAPTPTPAPVAALGAAEYSDHRASNEVTAAVSAQLRPIKRKRRGRKPVTQQSADEQPIPEQLVAEEPRTQQPVAKPRVSLKSKHPLEEMVQTPIPNWYPAFWSPAVQGCAILEDETARLDRAELLASTTTQYAIPQELTKRREKYWRVIPTVKLANATPRNQSKIFAFCIVIAPHLGTHITTKDDVAEANDIGLPAQLWKQVATGHGDDLGHPDGFERTKMYLHQFGMQSVVDRLEDHVPAIISSREPTDTKFIVPLLADVDELDYGEQRLVELEAHDWDPRYFQQGRVGEHEELRYQSEPLGWRYTALGIRQRRDAFIFAVPDSVGLQQGNIEDDCGPLQWRQVATTERDFGELFADSDVWECYEHGIVFLLPRYGDPSESDACGEHFLNASIIYRINGSCDRLWLTDGTRGANAAEYSMEPFVMGDMRVWHGHDEHRPYVTQLPTSIFYSPLLTIAFRFL